MRARESKRNFINLILTVLLITLFLSLGNTEKAFAEDGDTSSIAVSVSVTQSITGIGSDGNSSVVSVSTTGLEEGEYTAYLYYKASNSSSYSSKNIKLSAEGTAVFTGYPSLSNGRSYDIYVEIHSGDEVLARSENVTINAIKPSSLSATSTNSIEGRSTGTISVAGDYQYVAYYRKGGSIADAEKVTGTTITGLEAGEYYVFIPAYSVGNTYYIKSSSVKVTVGETAAEHYKVSLKSDEYSSWSKNDNDTVEVIQGSDSELTYQVSVESEYANDYILDEVALNVENASLAVEKTSNTSWTVTISNITGDVDVSVSAKTIPYYSVTLSAAEGALWSGGYEANAEVRIKSTSTKSIYLKPDSSEKYYVSGVVAEPAENIKFSFNEETGEIYISRISGNVVLIPQVEKKSIPAAIEVADVLFNDKGIYSEENPGIQVSFSVVVTDEEGNVIPGVVLYYKSDASDVSYTQSRESDENGIAVFTYSYGINEGETKADYTAVFATSSAFDENDIVASEEIHLVLQLKKDLVLYEDQIIATTPGESDGKVIDVPDNYELWSGEAVQGALVIGSGEWISSETGEYTGLSAGQHLIRAAEYIDKETNTFYFASDYEVFEVPRGFYTITADETNSPNVIFEEGTKQTSEPGGTVYFYVKPADGYTISGYRVSKENYINESRYDSENGYIVLEGISGSFELVVLTEAKTDNNTESGQQNTDNGQNNGGQIQDDQSSAPQDEEKTNTNRNSVKRKSKSKKSEESDTIKQETEPEQTEAVAEPVLPTEEITVDTEDVPKTETIEKTETVDAVATIVTTENSETTEIEDEQVAEADSYTGNSNFNFWPILIVLLGAVLVLVAAVVKRNAKSKESN